MNPSPTLRSVAVSLGLSVISILASGSPTHGQDVGPTTGETTVPSSTTPPTAPTTEPAATAPPAPTSAPPETTTTVTLPPTSETPAPVVAETAPRKREPAPTTRPTFVPPAGNPDAGLPAPPGSGPLDDAGTRYLPFMVFLSLGGFAVTAAMIATRWYQTRPRP